MIKIGDEVFAATLGNITFQKGVIGKIVIEKDGRTYHFKDNHELEISDHNVGKKFISSTSVAALKKAFRKHAEEELQKAMDEYFSKLEEKT